MNTSVHHLPNVLSLAVLALVLAQLTYHLASFPGLHGDEAWVGLRAIDIQSTGLTSLQGMNGYAGALFPQIVAAAFATIGKSVFSLRIPGALFNWLALAVMTITFWRRGHAAIIFLLLISSSLLFVYYSRVAWEVCALQNFLLSLIVAGLFRLAASAKPALGPTLLVLLAFSLGTWNHYIFLAASFSFALAAMLIWLRLPADEHARLLLLAAVNLVLQAALLIAKMLTPAGPFFSHILPALLAGLLLVIAAGIAYMRLVGSLLTWIAAIPVRKKDTVQFVQRAVVFSTAAVLVYAIVYDGPTFFGTVSGIIMLERVNSIVPDLFVGLAAQLYLLVLVATFVVLAVRRWRRDEGSPADPLKSLLLLWPLTFFPAFAIETLHTADRYFIIPQFLFFAGLALSFEDLPVRFRRGLAPILVLYFVITQQFTWREIAGTEDRRPITFSYGFYDDTSAHFLRLARLENYLEAHGFCSVESSSFFIAKPLRFLQSGDPACRSKQSVDIEYCNSCQEPVPWFQIGRPVVGGLTGVARP